MENPFESIQKQLGHVEALLGQALLRTAEPSTQTELPVNMAEAAKILLTSSKTIRRHIASIPHFKRHSQYYFFPSELVAYIRNGEISTLPEKSIIIPRRTRQRHQQT